MEPLRVGVVEEDEILSRGIVAVLEEDDCELVMLGTKAGSTPEVPGAQDVDVAVVCFESLGRVELSCPLVILTRLEVAKNGSRHADPRVKAILPHDGLTGDELVAGVRAAAAGLKVEPAIPKRQDDVLDPRKIEVLRLLAAGSDTRAIARKLHVSERTVKTLVHDIQLTLGAGTRAQAVAEGIRLGLV